jgi:hypothetical protein
MDKPVCQALGSLSSDLYPRPIAVGTVIWTSLSGRTYTTTPTGALFFPQLAVLVMRGV